MKLDEWDCKIIQHAKLNNEISVTEIKRIWAERCRVDISIVSSFVIAEHLLQMMHDCNILSNRYRFSDFIIRMVKETQKDDWDNFLYQILVRLIIIPVKDLPGYEDFLRKQQSNSN
jgi:hypothetical protein